MAKGPDWNDVHCATPGAVRDALTEPDIPFDDAPAAQQNGHGEAFYPPVNKQIVLPPSPDRASLTV